MNDTRGASEVRERRGGRDHGPCANLEQISWPEGR